MADPLRVLFVEDEENDALLLAETLEQGGYAVHGRRVDSAEDLAAALAEVWDVVITDYRVPPLSPLLVIQAVRERGLDLPIIVVSGTVEEEDMVAVMRAGAHDYMLKGNLKRLVPAVRRELQEAASRHARRAAERSAADSARQLGAVFDEALDAMLLTDDDGAYVAANPAACALFGLPREELLRRRVVDFAAPGFDAAAAWAEFRRAGRIKGEFRLLRPDGAFRDLEFSATADVLPHRHLSVMRDVTSRKAQEQEIREQKEILETLNRAGRLLSAELNLDKLVQGVTDAATELTGAQFGAFFYNVEDEGGERYTLYALSGVPREAFSRFPMPRNTDLFGPTFRGEAVVRIDDVRKDPRYGSNAPYYGMPEGHLPVTSYLAVPVVSRSGAVLGGLFFGHEHAAVFGEREERLVVGLAAQAAIAMDNARLYRQAQEANRMKDEFLATLSHELRTPMNAILGWAQLLREGKLDAATATRAAHTIDRNARVQTQLISDILDVSRIVSGRLRLDVRPVEMVRAVEAALDNLRPAAKAREIRLHTALDAGTGLISGDADRLQQVAWNLLSNAIKFTPHGGRVSVRLVRIDSHVELTVEDDGAGIDPDFLPFVFERFRQGDSSSTRPHGGLGLGLALVRHLVEMHGGTVHAASAGRNQGSTFIVKLPVMGTVRPDSGPLAPAEATSAGAPMAPAGSLAGVSVLLVDDEADARELFKTLLERSGARVTAVASGAEAFSAFTASPPDVVVSDIEMPEENGYDLIRRFRALPPERGGQTPAAALTAYARTEDRMRALRAGFQIHVSKPVQPAELVAVVANLARRHQARGR
jgi:PAS domain S-box-containing protein